MAYKIAGVPRAMTLCDHDVQRRCSPRANNLLQRRRHGGSLREHPADGGRRRRRTVRRGHRTRVSRTHRICAREALQCVLQDRPHIPAQHRFIAKHLRCRKESRRKQRRVRHAQIVEHTQRNSRGGGQARQNSSAVLWERYTFMGKHDTVPLTVEKRSRDKIDGTNIHDPQYSQMENSILKLSLRLGQEKQALAL